jgi:hypothetical protein
MIVAVIAGVLALCVVAHRRHRRSVLAGRVVNKPTYTVEAPGRRLSARTKEVL